MDSGLYFDRDTSFAGTQFRQTLEPRAMYLYVPYKDQEKIPVFDTSEPSFSYDSLWRENRFSGRDRIGDANQLSLGVTSRFIEPNGFERAVVSAGQIYYFRDRRVQLPGLTEKDLQLNPASRTPTMTAGVLRMPWPACIALIVTECYFGLQLEPEYQQDRVRQRHLPLSARGESQQGRQCWLPISRGCPPLQHLDRSIRIRPRRRHNQAA